MTSIEVNGTIDAPISTVWALLADARGYQVWGMMRSSTLERTGSPTDDGVGAVRRFGAWPVFSREEVVAFEPPNRLSYVLLSGLPVVNYRADVELRQVGQQTTVVWRAGFEPRYRWLEIPMRAFLSFILKDFVKRLKREAQKQPPVT